ncbi:aminotransferase class V-fold PLP-dependent enzyme, partial [Patescibacteria group bacterium]|nr:aminotransferase class V-fold PLP-dependent enzyme [Patescibacteria group bacterium]
MPLNPNQIRSQFPLLTEEITYLDSAATAQNPQSVIDAINDFYKTYNSNVHRGLYPISDKATEAYEDARLSVQSFINAKDPSEIIFTGGCTESINLVAKSWGKANLKKGDQVVLSILEHHSNITPWQQLKEEIGIEIEWIDISEEGELDIDQLDRVLSKGKVKLVSVTGQSNVIGVRPPIKEITDKAHDAGALTLVDAAQLIAHHKVDVQDLDCDFLAFSGHKLYGPTGIGVLYGNKELLKNMPAFMTGGGMIKEVTKDSFTSTDPPEK